MNVHRRIITNRLRPILGLLFAMTFLSGHALADTFEFLSFTPPAGWTKQQVQDGVTYRRPTGVGLIYLYNSTVSTGSAAEEFAKIWRARVEPTLPGAAPKPEIRPDGNYSVALGVKQVDAQGTITTFALFTVVGKGRALGVLAMAAGNDVFREMIPSLDTVKLDQSAAATAAQNPLAIEVDFDVPPGYTSQRDGGSVVLKPNTIDRTTPCIYGISPSRASRGSLEADARAAILEPLPGWQIKSDHYNAMRGTAGAGWPYYWLRTDVQRLAGPSYEYLTAMAMAFPSGQGRVSIFWGFGSTGPCNADDLTFLRLFFSLRPRGWTSDGGKAFARELHGLWRDTQNAGMAQYRFLPNGRYEYGLGTSTTFGNLETRTGSVGDGSYVLRGAELTITPDARGRGATKYRVRIYDEFLGGVWRRAMSLLNETAKPAIDVHYMKIEN